MNIEVKIISEEDLILSETLPKRISRDTLNILRFAPSLIAEVQSCTVGDGRIPFQSHQFQLFCLRK